MPGTLRLPAKDEEAHEIAALEGLKGGEARQPDPLYSTVDPPCFRRIQGLAGIVIRLPPEHLRRHVQGGGNGAGRARSCRPHDFRRTLFVSGQA